MFSAPEISCTALGFRSVGVWSGAVRRALAFLAFIGGSSIDLDRQARLPSFPSHTYRRPRQGSPRGMALHVRPSACCRPFDPLDSNGQASSHAAARAKEQIGIGLLRAKRMAAKTAGGCLLYGQ